MDDHAWRTLYLSHGIESAWTVAAVGFGALAVVGVLLTPIAGVAIAGALCAVVALALAVVVARLARQRLEIHPEGIRMTDWRRQADIRWVHVERVVAVVCTPHHGDITVDWNRWGDEAFPGLSGDVIGAGVSLRDGGLRLVQVDGAEAAAALARGWDAYLGNFQRPIFG